MRVRAIHARRLQLELVRHPIFNDDMGLVKTRILDGDGADSRGAQRQLGGVARFFQRDHRLLADDGDGEVEILVALLEFYGRVAHLAQRHVPGIHSDIEGGIAVGRHLDVLGHGDRDVGGRRGGQLPVARQAGLVVDGALDRDPPGHDRHVQAGIVGVPQFVLQVHKLLG